MTTATAEPIADPRDGKVKTKLTNVTPELDAAMRRWYKEVNVILRTLRAPSFILREVQADSGSTDDHRIDTALLTTEQCIAMLDNLEDELGYAAHGKVLIAAEPAAA